MTALTFDETAPFASDDWQQQMLANGDSLKRNKVRLILLVHGTFAGNDALGLFDLFEPIIGETTTDLLRKEGKELLDKIANDVGNYTSEYANALGNALDNSIASELFTWSSGNFHLARLKGAVELAQALAEHITRQNIVENERLLLLGHSHAGQLFALLTNFLANDERARQLYAIMDKHPDLSKNKKNLAKQLEVIKTVYLDIVTFGTPVRYAWGNYDKYRLMPVVNYRSMAQITGLSTTADGDYVQQWGGAGTDMLVLSEINDELDTVLDKGRDRALLLARVKRKKRKQPRYANGTVVSKTVLVDYKDDAALPNCILTVFGHGVYTRKSTMLFNMNMIVKNWYA